jgi:coenzyme F420-0:L-glutamate ligase / coenzyme F420-1:gamma-L-glutamate ligase
MTEAIAGHEAWPQFAAIVRGRASVRHFDDRPVPRPLIEQIVEAGAWAPSPHGRQPWRFVILTNPATKLRLAEAMGETWQEQLSMDGDPPDVIAARRAGSHRRVVLAPVLIIPCLYVAPLDVYPDANRQEAEHIMAVQSLGAATQNMLLMTYALGLDGGWMCAPLFCPDIVRTTLGLPEGVVPHAMLTIGYRGRDPRRRPRLPMDQIVILDD